MTSAEPSLLLAVGSLILGLAASVLWTLTRYLIIAAHEVGMRSSGRSPAAKWKACD